MLTNGFAQDEVAPIIHVVCEDDLDRDLSTDLAVIYGMDGRASIQVDAAVLRLMSLRRGSDAGADMTDRAVADRMFEAYAPMFLLAAVGAGAVLIWGAILDAGLFG
jgi:hypothetical protein